MLFARDTNKTEKVGDNSPIGFLNYGMIKY